MKSIIYFAFVLCSITITAQETINTMFYNLLEFPEASPGGRSEILRNILSDFEPDLFMVCELQNEAGAEELLNVSLNYNTISYSRADFIANQSSDSNLQQLIFFKTSKFILESSEILTNSVRDINKYVLKLNTVDQIDNPIYVYVYVAHLKSSQGSSNQNLRLEMVNEFTEDLENLAANSNVIFAGDFNVYTFSEPAYQEILDPTNAIVMIDPIDTPGSWHNNDTYQDIHTQSTRINSGPFGAGAGGGLDDRFDFIMISENMNNNPELKYLSDSYKAFGNNGNCFNLDISDEGCVGPFSQSLRNSLYSMSDHLPVLMKLESNQDFILSSSNFNLDTNYAINQTIVQDHLTISVSNNTNITFYIYNTIGQKIKEFKSLFTEIVDVDVSDLNNGMYFIKTKSNPSSVLKFIKK